jgi:TnpA family transposase
MSIVRELMEKEIASGWSDGEYANADNARTVTDADGISVTYTASHYPEPATISYEGTRPYKLIGWQVSWQETAYDQTGSINCNERAVTYVAYR